MVSAITGQGCEELLDKLDATLARDKKIFSLKFAHQDGADVALYYNYGEVLDRIDSEECVQIKVRLDQAAMGQLRKMGQKLEKSDEC